MSAAKFGMKCLSWLAIPRKLHRDVTFLGAGNSEMASVLAGSGQMPSGERMKPAN